MFTVPTSQGDITISRARVIRAADRMWRWSSERRLVAVAAAKDRLAGKHPQKRDSAIIVALS